MAKVKSGKYVKFLIYLVAVVLVNLAGITLFQRFDLTANGAYSLSEASRRAVATLSEPLTINVFFTKNLPAPYNNTERYLRDLLEEYAIYAGKYFNYRFYNVSPEEGDLKPGAETNRDLADNYGISPIQIQVIEKDEVKFQKAYMGLVILHGDLIERIPTITSVDRLEYQLTTAIMKLNNKVSALLRLQDKIRIALFLSSSLNKVAPIIGLDDLPDLPQRVGAIVDKLNTTHLNKLDYVRLDPSTNPDAVRELQTEGTVESQDVLVQEVETGLGPFIREAGSELVPLDLVVLIVAPTGRQPDRRETAERVVQLAVEIDPPLLEVGIDARRCAPARLPFLDGGVLHPSLSGAFGQATATTFRMPRTLLTTSVAKASPSTSSAIIMSGLPILATCSRIGSRSFMLLIFFSLIKI